MIEKQKIDEITNLIRNCDKIKFLIKHDNNCYTFTNLKYKIIFKIQIKKKSKNIDEFLENSEITFFSLYNIKFGKKKKDGRYDLSEFTKEFVSEIKKNKIKETKVRKINYINRLKSKLINKYKIYFMAAEKMEIAYACINL